MQISYCGAGAALTALLKKVSRPGEFFSTGRTSAPMPRVDVEGAGPLSFPVPPEQARRLISVADQAPYGRGEETLVDTSVRRVWQIGASKVQIVGRTWEATFYELVQKAVAGLGIAGDSVRADLYKLLVYEEGGFFLCHRDTEKSAGMFGTLVVSLPSDHTGGELVVRHGGRETTLDLTGTEPSELVFAAFYADCEHEVRPIRSGHRICLVFNLIMTPGRKGAAPATPDVRPAVAAVAAWLQTGLAESEGPPKLTWLLEHQYSPKGLSWAGLKNADAAQASVLRQAAEQAGCNAYLALVHIEESGPAERVSGGYGGGRGRSQWYGDDDYAGYNDENAEFNVVEVTDRRQYVDPWVGPGDVAAPFGKIPLADGELLPAGALDGEQPDRKRLTEATGNAGASFERSYHRAAVVLFRKDREGEILLQAGPGPALGWLDARVAAGRGRLDKDLAFARLILDAWPTPGFVHYRTDRPDPPTRTGMLRTLRRLEAGALLASFWRDVVLPGYDGTENQELAYAARWLPPGELAPLAGALIEAKVPSHPGACLELSERLANSKPGKTPAAQRAIAEALVAGWARIEPAPSRPVYWQAPEDGPAPEAPSPAHAARIFELLGELGCSDLRLAAAEAITAKPAAFNPVTFVVPLLAALPDQLGAAVTEDQIFPHLWRHAAEFLLHRSGVAPVRPSDWRLPAALKCECEDCAELRAFARDPQAQVRRFRVRKERRQHLHAAIDGADLDMTHVTERKGSPQTLVCTKTRRTWERRRDEYRRDVDAMTQLAALATPGAKVDARVAERIVAAIQAKAAWTE